MPRKASQPSLADQHAAPGGAAAVDRALSVLSAFRTGDRSLTLAELAERTQLYKSTVLRLLASLEHGRLVQRTADGHYALGAEIARLHGVYAASFSLEAVVMPVLQELARLTRESAAFHVRQGEHRLCLYRVDSPQPVRDHIKAGDLLPLDRGAGGRVLTAFGGAPGEPYESIRQSGVVVLEGDRMPELSGISAPVFNATGELAGAVTLTMPTPRLQRDHAALVVAAAADATRKLGGFYPWPND
ncbi:HTH-type transcriptional regulator KipR [Achromobacter deleyi]|uniref:HTH-type transcriptional regulator KipR n=1 Tax=Achromobacter deleyi TaxID=1353891 RepID=A0A6S7BBQ9_9BURK|nr:IclR family transcriptional regulator [Achromobacter deleyi]CAB3725392.1 HTH-type transcriptional regulator KipR [Achromobacter deleyi]CAB3819824.1 HTH-type transcriptional regulator KipR [Achromobacter deleyi]CAB3822207.1 HTH-type transcriptional regulator KipR [Achromobacter deleyi]